jgi:uncharacterized protein (TIGR03083 family)
VVHAERSALLKDLEQVPLERWSTASLCPGWDVHDLLAHLVDDANTTRLGFVRHLAAARFDFDRCNAAGVERERAATPSLTLARFAAAMHRTTSAPAPAATRLVEVFVHGEDIRRPLGLSRDYPASEVIAALRYQLATSVKRGGGKERALGLKLVPTDGDSPLGDGEEVRGSAIALLMAVSGRPTRDGEISGPGSLRLSTGPAPPR